MEKYAKLLNKGAVGVIPTDTLYGIVAGAFDKNSVERVYRLKGRNSDKPLIILLRSIDDLERFNITLSSEDRSRVTEVWPGKVSIVFRCEDGRFEYLHRGGKTLAFRVPAKKNLLELLKSSGPLVAPSANLQGYAPATNIQQARRYFAEKVDFYLDGGDLISKPSSIIKINKGEIEVLREGAVKI